MLSRVMQSKTYAIGLDAGAESVRLLQVRKGSAGLEVRGAAQIELGGERIKDAQDWARAVAEAVAAHADLSCFAGRKCIIGVSDDWVRARSIRQPKMPANEIDKAVRLDGPSRLGFADGEACEFGWVRAGEVRQGNETRDEIIMVGAATSVLETLVYGVSAAGLRPVSVEPSFMSSARAMSRKHRRAGDQGDVRIVVEVGRYSTRVMVLKGSTIVFYKPIEIGGQQMSDAAANRLGQELESVETIRHRRMMGEAAGVDARVDRAIFEAVRPILGDLATEVGRCGRYYGVTFRGARVQRCHVIGTEAREPELCRFIEDAVNVETAVGDPLGHDGGARWSSVVRHGSCWAGALGLSLRSGEARLRGTNDVKDRESDIEAPEGVAA